MKRRLTLMITAIMLLMTSFAWGQTRDVASITFSEQGYTNGQSLSGIPINLDSNITIQFDKNTGNTAPAYYNTGAAARLYGGNTLTITPASGCSITGMTLTFSSTSNVGTLSASTGTYSLSSTTGTWTGSSSTSIVITNTASSGHARLSTLSVTYSAGGTPSVATPTFDPAAGTYTEAQNVTISCTTDGATIHYTLDGTTPTTSSDTYSTPIAISETTTVKAMAVKNGMNNSSVASATYTFPVVYTTIAAWKADHTANSSDVSTISGDLTAVFQNDKSLYVQDTTGALLIFGTVGKTYNNGDVIIGGISGTAQLYNGTIEFIPTSTFPDGVAGTAVEPIVVTAAEVIANYSNYEQRLVKMEGIVFNENYDFTSNKRTTTFTQGQTTYTLYDSFKKLAGVSVEQGETIDLVGLIGCYKTATNDTKQIFPRSSADLIVPVVPTDTVDAPTFTPVEGVYTEALNVAIECATEGATIYYTLDGTTPTANSTVYTDSIAISETTTVKAFAVKADMIDSEVATAEYTIEPPTPPTPTETSYKLITNANALIAGDKYIIVGIKGTDYKALGKQATNNRPSVAVTPSNDTITVTPASGADEDAVYELTLGQEGNYWTFYDAVNSGYLYAASSSGNHLKTQAENNANGQWTIEIASSGVATIKAQGTYTHNWLRLNDNGTPFSCYASGQKDVYLYKAGDVPTPPAPTYHNVAVADSIANGTVTAAPTSALANDTITVTATPAAGYELTTLTYTYGQTTIDIDQTTMQFLMPEADVTVNATFSELDAVATPSFTPAAGMYISAQTVALACETEGATIYYTTDGTEPTTESTVYTEEFVVSMTTTIKAFAVKEGMNNSAIATAQYTMIEVMTIESARTLALNEYALVQGIVTFIDGRNVYVQDATAGIVLYLNNNTVPDTLAIGDMVKGYGKMAVYNGLVELKDINGGNDNQFIIVSNDNPLPLAEKTIAEILEDHAGNKMLQSTRVQIIDAICGAINYNNNTPISQGESTLNIYKMPVVSGLEQGDIVTVTGIIGCYNTPQLRVANAADIEYTHPPMITANPTALSGFNYVYEEGPSAPKSFVISANHISAMTYIEAPESYELSSFPGEAFHAEDMVIINTFTGVYNYTIKVRLKEGLEVGEYDEILKIYEEEIDTIYIALSGTVTSTPPQPQGDYTRVSELSQLTSGSKVIFAARFDENTNDYYAMTAQASGKPEGVLFTSIPDNNGETLPAEITDAEETYYWTVDVEGENYTFTNANGDVLGYNSSTNFANGGDNTAWAITFQTSDSTAMVPNYSAFVINNVNNAVRAFALNSNHNFGPYHTQNMASDSYNFFIDMFATVGGGTLTCATPTFTPEAGTYFEEQTVAIACTTADATIYYTLDGTDPDENSEIYSEPIAVAESMTIKAIAMKEGYENSNIATAEYTIILGAVTIFNQDWEGDMNGWTFVTVEGSKPWNISQYQGNHYAYANGYNGGVNEQWCISPAFNLYVYSNVSLNFRNAKNYTGPDMQLFFSNDYDGENPAEATWTELEFNKSTGSFAWAESGTIELAGFTGDECYIGFKYTSTETEASAWEVDDIVLMGFTADPVVTVTPLELTGFSYIEGNGPSAEQSFLVSGMNLTENVVITINSTSFEMSDETGEDFVSITELGLIPYDGAVEVIVYVRMAADLTADNYEAYITIGSELDDITVNMSGTVNPPSVVTEWNRILSLNDLHDGDQVIIASRYDATVGDGYYAMPAVTSGKPDGVLFTSVNNEGIESVPAEIAEEADTYLWNVTLDGNVIILVNAAGDTLGYSSSTNFANGVNPEWNIALETAGDGAMIPNYTGFVITNATTTNRGIAKNASHKFGAYSTSNLNNADYNFYQDLFVNGGSVTPTVATPVFSMPSGTYYEAIEVEITCATEGATIYYTTDGSDPTAESEVYAEPIVVESDMTIKAIAMMEGYDNSGIASASYTIMTDVVVILSQDWEGDMDGWTFVTVEGNKPWAISEHNGNHYANANGYGDEVNNEQWCISPAFDLSGRDERNVTLTFMNAMKFNGPALELYISENYDGQDPTTATWEPLEYIASEGNYVWTESGEISLNAYAGSERCNIAFRYISTIEDGAASWEIDDILIVADKYDNVITAEASFNVEVWNSNNALMIANDSDSMLNVVVYNLVGQPVLSETVATGTSTIRHDLVEGVYIVRIANGKEMKGIKVVVRR